jgi:hypothetical protein
MRLLVVVTLALLVREVSAQQSMRLTARANGGVASNSVDYMEPILSLQELVDRSDFIIHGRITASHALLFMEDRFVGTDYTVFPFRVLKLNPTLNISRRPGLTPSAAVVRRMGGTVIDGPERYTTKNPSFPESEAPRAGDEVIWFLRYEPGLQVFSLVGGSFGAFRIESGKVHPQTVEAATRRGDKPAEVSAFLQDVQERIDQKR